MHTPALIRIFALLLTLVAASGATYPNAMASGNPVINNSLLFTGSDYATLGQPSALTSVLTTSHEWTILVRRARAAAGSTGVIIGQADATNTTFSISTNGGSAETGNIGGTTFTTGSGSVKEPTWDAIALICHNVSGTFMGSILLDAGARSTEVAVGSQASAKDILIGGRRNSSNSDSAALFSGNIDCIAIWNYALTDAQIHSAMAFINPNDELYQSFNGTNYATGLIAYYPCNEGSGTTLNDCQGGNNGTLTSNVFSTAQFSKPPIVTIGDSLTNGSGGTYPYGDQVVTGGSGLRNGRVVYVYGFSGQNVTYIATQLALSTYTPFLTWTQVYLVGIHDLGNTSTVTNFLSTEIATLPHSRYLIIGNRAYAATGVVNGVGNPNAAGIGDWGTTTRAQIDAMNIAEQAIYGWRFMSEQAIAQSQNSIPGNNDDFQLRTPVNIAADNTHLLDVGYILMSQDADQLATACGW